MSELQITDRAVILVLNDHDYKGASELLYNTIMSHSDALDYNPNLILVPSRLPPNSDRCLLQVAITRHAPLFL